MNNGEVLSDVLAPGLAAVFVGTAVGTTSAIRQAYYAGSGNKFWRVLAETGLTPRRLRPQDYREILKFGFGLTDVVKDQFGPDNALQRTTGSGVDLRERLLAISPTWIAFNGKTAARWALGRRRVDYGEQPERWGSSRLFVLPSTSGAANGYWDEDVWRRFAEQACRSIPHCQRPREHGAPKDPCCGL